jgi:hypothetical protein
MSLLRILVVILAALAAGQSLAHGNYKPGNTSGIAIPSLSHGEMAVIADYRSRILAIAGQVDKTDPIFRRLLNFGAIQYSHCLWGVAPGAITDEQSPFNECAHAYLSAAKALLFHMRDMPDVAEQANALISDIDADVVSKGAAFIGCQYSGESFNTAEFLRPHWEKLPEHRPTLLALAAGILLLVSPVAIRLAQPLRRRERKPRSADATRL